MLVVLPFYADCQLDGAFCESLVTSLHECKVNFVGQHLLSVIRFYIPPISINWRARYCFQFCGQRKNGSEMLRCPACLSYKYKQGKCQRPLLLDVRLFENFNLPRGGSYLFLWWFSIWYNAWSPSKVVQHRRASWKTLDVLAHGSFQLNLLEPDNRTSGWSQFFDVTANLDLNEKARKEYGKFYKYKMYAEKEAYIMNPILLQAVRTSMIDSFQCIEMGVEFEEESLSR